MASRTRPPRPTRQTGLILGLAAFEKIAAVDGRFFTPEQRAILEDYERRGLSPEERGRDIIARHSPKHGVKIPADKA